MEGVQTSTNSEVVPIELLIMPSTSRNQRNNAYRKSAREMRARTNLEDHAVLDEAIRYEQANHVAKDTSLNDIQEGPKFDFSIEAFEAAAALKLSIGRNQDRSDTEELPPLNVGHDANLMAQKDPSSPAVDACSEAAVASHEWSKDIGEKGSNREEHHHMREEPITELDAYGGGGVRTDSLDVSKAALAKIPDHNPETIDHERGDAEEEHVVAGQMSTPEVFNEAGTRFGGVSQIPGCTCNCVFTYHNVIAHAMSCKADWRHYCLRTGEKKEYVDHQPQDKEEEKDKLCPKADEAAATNSKSSCAPIGNPGPAKVEIEDSLFEEILEKWKRQCRQPEPSVPKQESLIIIEGDDWDSEAEVSETNWSADGYDMELDDDDRRDYDDGDDDDDVGIKCCGDTNGRDVDDGCSIERPPECKGIGEPDSRPIGIDKDTLIIVSEKIHQLEDCHCIRPNVEGSKKKVRLGGCESSFGTNLDFGVIGKRETGAAIDLMTVRTQNPICAMGEPPEWQEIEITVDSGACDTVMPAGMCTHISIVSTPESRAGLEYEVANGAGLPNLGQRSLLMMTENSHLMKQIIFQCADVHKALLSVSKVADMGFECIMGKLGGKLVDVVTGDVIPLHRRGNLYVMKAWVKQDRRQDSDPGFTRRG